MKFVSAVALLAAISVPVSAAAPSFQTAAPIAYMWDVSSGAELFVKDADKQMPPASMAKMMTVYVAFDMIKHGELRLDQKFTVMPEIWQKWHGPEAGSTMFLSVNEQVTVADLLSGIVTLSGNDACVTLATGVSGSEPAFAERMNRTAQKLGLTNSHFGTSNGWPDNGVTHVTARDLAHLAVATISDFPDLYKRFYGERDFTHGKTMGGKDIKQDNRNPLLGHVSGADGLKTGHTDEAGYGFTGSAEQGGRRLVMVVAGLDSKEHRAEESVKLINWGFQAWHDQSLFAKGAHVGDVKVSGGDLRKVGLVAPQNIMATMPAGAQGNVSFKIDTSAPVKAPIMAGQQVATLIITAPEMPVARVPLAAEKDVAEAGFFQRIWNAIMSLFGA